MNFHAVCIDFSRTSIFRAEKKKKKSRENKIQDNKLNRLERFKI